MGRGRQGRPLQGEPQSGERRHGPVIGTGTHGVLDYASSLLLLAGPRLLGWNPSVRRFTDGAALGTAAYAALTAYEAGLVPALSLRRHLSIDLAEGAAFLAAAGLMRQQPAAVRLALAGYGLFALGAAAATWPTAAAPASRAEGPGRRTRAGAWVMDTILHEDEPGKETMMREEERHIGTEAGASPGHRVAAAEWRQSRAATYDTGRRARDQVGRDAAPIPTPGAVGRSEWRQAGRAARPDMAMAGSASHATPGTLGSLDLRATDRFPRRG